MQVWFRFFSSICDEQFQENRECNDRGIPRFRRGITRKFAIKEEKFCQIFNIATSDHRKSSAEMKLLIFLLPFLANPWVSARSLESFYESPPWSLVQGQPQNSTFETRLYNSTKWLEVSVQAFSEYEAAEIGFDLVYRYTKGNNSKGLKLAMTVPFTVQAYHSECVLCVRNFKVSYYIPRNHQTSPPTPSDPRMSIVKRRETTAYVRPLTSMRKPIQFRYEANAFYRHLQRHQIFSIDRQTMLFATYDGPFKTFQSSNQVWLFPTQNFYEYEEEPEEEMIQSEE